MRKLPDVDGSTGPRIFEIIRDRILDGALLPGTPLSSAPRLSREMHAARSAAAGALDQLVAEGYLRGAPAVRTRWPTVLRSRWRRCPTPLPPRPAGSPPTGST